MAEQIFKNRREAGKKLAEALSGYRGNNNLILALPRGGVIVAEEVARRWRWPLDLIFTRKIGHPNNREYAVGAVSEDGEILIDQGELPFLDPRWLREEVKKEITEAKRRRVFYLKGQKGAPVVNREIILIDDGLATGLSMEVAIKSLRKRQPLKIVVAVPVAPKDAAMRISALADEFVALKIPELFEGSVGAYYKEFEQVSDLEVVRSLASSRTF